MTSFNVIKNINESFDFIISGFVVNTTPIARILDNIEMAVAFPTLTTKKTTNLNIVSSFVVAAPTLTVTASTYTFNTTASDCTGSNLFSNFSSTSTALDFGGMHPSNPDKSKTWIPFPVALGSNHPTIVSAVINLTAVGVSTASSQTIKIGCENVSNPVSPTSWDELNMRVMTANFIDANFEVWTVGQTYSYDITTAVQEILSKTDRVDGDVLAVLFHSYMPTEYIQFESCASYENGTYAAPTLVINL